MKMWALVLFIMAILFNVVGIWAYDSEDEYGFILTAAATLVGIMLSAIATTLSIMSGAFPTQWGLLVFPGIMFLFVVKMFFF